MFSVKKVITVVILSVMAYGVFHYFFQKVCEPLPEDFFKESLPPEQRSDEKGFIYHYWQKIDGRWNACSTRFENDWHV